jgi:hypothetical protein
MAILRRKSRNRRQVVSSIAALKALKGMTDGQAAQVLGYDSAADGGADVKKFDASSGATDNGGTVHRPTAGPPATGNGRWISVGPKHMDARKFGVLPLLSASTLTTRMNAALAAAKANSCGVLHVGPGHHEFNGQLTVDDVVLRGESSIDTYLYCKKQLGAGVPFITCKQTSGLRNRAGLRDLWVAGPGTRCLGKKTAKGDGIKVEDDMTFVDVTVNNFDSGFIVDHNPLRIFGHDKFHRILATDNYYGVYFTKAGLQGGDFHFLHCDINGNTFAGIGWSGNWLMPGFSWLGGHCGYQPFGLFQEATTDGSTNPFCNALKMDYVMFENIGNCAIYTENWNGTNPNHGAADGLWLDECGFSRNTDTWRIGTQPFATPVKLGPVRGLFRYRSPIGGFNGNTGSDPAIYFRAGRGHVDVDYTAAQSSHATAVEMGDKDYQNVRYIPREWPQFNAQINSPATSTTINTNYQGPAESLRPHLIPVTNGGLGAFQLYVDETTIASNASTDVTSFTVRVSGGTPTSDLKFRLSYI